MQPEIPFEIVDHILSFLRDDHYSLKRCAEVNHNFSDIVERHLYHQISLDNFVPDGDIDAWETGNLAKSFTENPRLGAHVRVVRMSIAARETLQWYFRPVTKEDRIGEILPMFTQITTVVLSGKMPWSRLHKDFQKSFIQMLVHTTTLEDISIHQIQNFPLNLLNHCRSLKHLSLIETENPQTEPPVPSDIDQQRAQLTSLDIAANNVWLAKIFKWIRSPYSPDIQRLSSLSTDVPGKIDFPQLQALLDDCASTLMDVSLGVYEDVAEVHTISHIISERVYLPHGAPPPVIDLSRLRSLRCLSILGDIKYHCVSNHQEAERSETRTPIPWFVQLLRTISAPNGLECITLGLIFIIIGSQMGPYMKIDWEPLVEVLTSDSFNSLGKVEIQIYIKPHQLVNFDSYYEHFISLLHDDVHLSSLMQSGLLSIISDLPKVN